MAKKKEKTFEPMPDDLLALQDEYISVDAEITRLEERKKQLQDRMLELMQTHDLKKAENERIRISYIAPSKRKNFDKTRFQEEHKDMYAQYLVDVETKASIRVSIKTQE
jgi:hypothetical protein